MGPSVQLSTRTPLETITHGRRQSVRAASPASALGRLGRGRYGNLAAVLVAYVERAALLVALAACVAEAFVTALAAAAVVIPRALHTLPLRAARRGGAATSIAIARSIGDTALAFTAQLAKIVAVRVGADRGNRRVSALLRLQR